MRIYQISPQDVLAFRRRYTESVLGSRARAARWLSPSIVFDALHASLHRAFPQVELWERLHATGKNGHYPNREENSQRFGSLKTAGPFPIQQSGAISRWLFPGPGDAVIGLEGQLGALLPLKNAGERHNLPPQLRFLLGHPFPLDREQPALWWSKAAMESWLANRAPDPGETWFEHELFTVEPGRRFGARHGLTEAANPDVSWQVRLGENVTLGALASLPLREPREAEGMEKLFPAQTGGLVLGGQQRTSRIRKLPALPLEALLPMSAPVVDGRLKWMLLSPAVFPAMESRADGAIHGHPGGWLPNWVCPAPFLDSHTNRMIEPGQVLLRKGDVGRQPGEPRDQWRRRVRSFEFIECRLVAACVPEPMIIGGWSENRHLLINAPNVTPSPKDSYLAVPPGAVYYFEGPGAAELSDALAWHGAEREGIKDIHNRRSTRFGEKGFGLGVCGSWKFYGD
ncbi:MAG: type III-B CRISPR module-associated protein Cmr3 [Candidatus Omnitrophica bacterium]|nr:type III-B CRISPR module-associated protein Cmr3 [Candidatus Omnitrophota bacterium]